jgi:hypothetical protein
LDTDTDKLRRDLKRAGLSEQAIEAAWPAWWSDAAATSRSAQAELRFTLARRLGLSAKSLSGDRVEFVWKDVARFKHLSNEDEAQQAALTSFGRAIGHLLLQATPGDMDLAAIVPEELRETVLSKRAFVDLPGLLATCWAVGVPVIYLRVFPLAAKAMHAMVVKAAGRYAILLGRDAQYPAPVAFALAHELGHAVLGHLATADALVDLTDPAEEDDEDDEETSADRFALALLTGQAKPDIKTNIDRFGARQLAEAVLTAGPARGIEPGTLALCLAYRTKKWATASKALRYIYVEQKPVWREINSVAENQLDWDALPADGAEYLRTVMAIGDA